MHLARLSYFADFVVYPLAILIFVGAAYWVSAPGDHLAWLTSFVAGVALWTLLEYLLHRYAFHHAPVIKDMHGAHHDDQKALIGSPTWLSFAIMLAGVFVPAFFLGDGAIASALTAGLMLGYLWYVSVHHIVHHWSMTPGTYGFNLKRRHMLHHKFAEGNFGVTSGFWDHVFGTDVKLRSEARER